MEGWVAGQAESVGSTGIEPSDVRAISIATSACRLLSRTGCCNHNCTRRPAWYKSAVGALPKPPNFSTIGEHGTASVGWACHPYRMPNGRNADADVVADKLARIRDPHVRPLNALSDVIADSVGLPHGHVPYVDPDQGGINARMLVLLDNPSTKAESGTGSGLLSLDNNDRTARNCREAYERHGVSHADVVHWNVVPFPVAGIKNGGSTPAERTRSVQWTKALVELCPRIEIVLLLGAAARDGWARSGIDRDLYVVPGKIPHCSARGLNTGGGRERFESAIAQVSEMLR